MKKWIFLSFVAAFMLIANAGWTSAAAAPSKKDAAVPVPKLYLNGIALETEAPPEMVNASVLVPARTITESLGFKVDYDDKKKQVKVQDGTLLILMKLNDSKATVNGKEVTLVEPPLIRSNRAMVPVRFVTETLGLEVYWDNPTKSVFLYSKVEPTPPSGSDGEPQDGGGAEAPADNGGGGSPGNGTDNGGLIGVVEPEDPGSTGGNGDSGSLDPGKGDGSGDEEDPHGSGTTDGNPPAVPPGDPVTVHQIRYEPNYLVVTYEGTLNPVVQTVSDPDRIVIDLPHADYAEDFTAGFASGLIEDYKAAIAGAPEPGQVPELTVVGHEALGKIRYSRYTDNPKSARIVLDLNQAWGYEVISNAAEGRLIVFLKKNQIPVKKAYTVVLDAGHGGSDPGAQSATGRWEKEFTLSVVKKVRDLLRDDPKISLILTREEDSYPTLDDRVNLANGLSADLFLSVHGNSFKPDINGTETYYNRSDSLAFAKLLHRNAVAATGFKDNNVRKANYKVIRDTTMPAVLLEVGYLSNKSEEKQMYSDALQNRVAAAIAASIRQYFHLE